MVNKSDIAFDDDRRFRVRLDTDAVLNIIIFEPIGDEPDQIKWLFTHTYRKIIL